MVPLLGVRAFLPREALHAGGQLSSTVPGREPSPRLLPEVFPPGVPEFSSNFIISHLALGDRRPFPDWQRSGRSPEIRRLSLLRFGILILVVLPVAQAQPPQWRTRDDEAHPGH
jgi:hypothetical protein